MDYQTLLLGLLIFAARVTDVTVGTIRTISIVQGRTIIAFCLAIVEISIWLMVISSVLGKISAQPLLAIFYAAGYATGNVVGIKLEKRLAFGHIILRIFSCKNGYDIADRIRNAGYAVTTFQGEGKNGPVLEDCIVCTRKDLKKITSLVNQVEPNAFYITEQAGAVSKIYRPFMTPPTGWRAILKKK